MKEFKLTYFILINLILFVGIISVVTLIRLRPNSMVILNEVGIVKKDKTEFQNGFYARSNKSYISFKIDKKLSSLDKFAYLVAYNPSFKYGIYFFPFILVFHLLLYSKFDFFSLHADKILYFLIFTSLIGLLYYDGLCNDIVNEFVFKFIPKKENYYASAGNLNIPFMFLMAFLISIISAYNLYLKNKKLELK